MIKNILCFLTLTSLIFSCGGKNFEEPGDLSGPGYDTQVDFRLGFDKTWSAVENVMSRFPIFKKVRKEGYVETDWVYGSKSDLLYSGYGEVRVPYKIRYKIIVGVVAKSPDRTEIIVKAKEQYWSDVITKGDDFQGSIYRWYDTKSSSRKERKVLEKIQEELYEILKK
ncbi:MAG: hypothetical protein ABIA04_12190 [Pseudomonadota bacterium]